MTLQEACKFLENIELVPINFLDNESEIKDFVTSIEFTKSSHFPTLIK